MPKIGVLLINVGTPDEPTTEAVRRYLLEFLTDPYVIQVPKLIREWVFGKWIVPRRAKQSALKYQSIWREGGSPLLLESQKFSQALQQTLGEAFIVQLGMRYGNPTIPHALENLRRQNVDQIVIAPMFPQYAAATADSGLAKVQETLSEIQWSVKLVPIKEFYNSEEYLQSCQDDLAPTREQWDHIVFSFHGLPVSQIKKIPGCMVTAECCARFESEGRRCYRGQCLRTAELLADRLDLSRDQWSVSFQSRLGPTQWLEPYTDFHLQELAKQGTETVAVYAPSFVVDGLETLEELAIHGKQTYLKAGGGKFIYLPCLNASESWVKNFAQYLRLSIQ